MDAMDRVLAETSPDDTAAALRLLKVLEECRQISPVEAEAWRRRIKAWMVAFMRTEPNRVRYGTVGRLRA
jgi:hypothetical protein